MVEDPFLDPSEISEVLEHPPYRPEILCVQHWERKLYVREGNPMAIDEDGILYPSDDEESDSDDDTDDEMEEPNESWLDRRRRYDCSNDSECDTDDEHFGEWAFGVMEDARKRRRLNGKSEEFDSSDEDEYDDGEWKNAILENHRRLGGAKNWIGSEELDSSDEEQEDVCRFASL